MKYRAATRSNAKPRKDFNEEYLPVLPEEYRFDWYKPTKAALLKIPVEYFTFISSVYFKCVPYFIITGEELKEWTINSIMNGKPLKIKYKKNVIY